VKEAGEKGYTEPDPRIDLNGVDVRRKLLILSRESGMTLESDAIEIKNILPDACQTAPSVDLFFEALEKSDDYFEKMITETNAKGNRLRMIAKLIDGKAEIALEEVDDSHPFYSLSGSDNMIVFTTERYKERPLVVRGPGAGAEVTAAGVFAEIVTIGSYLS
jgi:aspartokinase/homoserine dehydrogenase 1